MTDPHRAAVVVRTLGADIGDTPILRDVSFDVAAGEIVALFGPSGAGKSTIAAAVADLDRPGIRWYGEVLVEGESRERASRVGYLPQHAPATLNPARRIGRALDELVRLHDPRAGAHPHAGQRSGAPARRPWIAEVLRMAGFDLSDNELSALLRRFPFEFSGGQRTRLALAQILASRPTVLVLDEPTVGLDPLSRERLLAQFERLRDIGLAMLLVTHDRAAVERLATRTVVVRAGHVVDHRRGAPTAEPVATAESPVRGQQLISTPAAELRAVEVRIGRTPIVRDLELAFWPAETIGMLGVSGAGKSTIARCLAGLVPPSKGAVLVGGNRFPALRRRTRDQLAAVQYIWQESAASFEPRRRVLDQVAASAVRLRGLSTDDALAEALASLHELDVDADQARRYPIGLSGGQLQRAAVARALLAGPSVLLCDEVTTGPDEPLARRILDALRDYQSRTGAALLVIGHDVPTLRQRADRIAVVDDGRVVEVGTPTNLLASYVT